MRGVTERTKSISFRTVFLSAEKYVVGSCSLDNCKYSRGLVCSNVSIFLSTVQQSRRAHGFEMGKRSIDPCIP